MSATYEIDEILVSVSPGETRAALVAEGRLVELLLAREAKGSLVGNIYLGRVGKPAPGTDASFIELGEARAGFLARGDAKDALNARGERHARAPSEGEAVLVEVTQDAFGRKGPRVAATLALPGHWLVFSPSRPGLAISRRIADAETRARLEAQLAPHLAEGEGVVVRTAAEAADGATLLDELVRLRGLWQKILADAARTRAPALLHADADPIERVLRDHGGPSLRRVCCDRREALRRAEDTLARQKRAGRVEVVLHQGPEPLFARHEIDEQIREALEPVAALPSGGSLVIGTLEALSAIDVNTARQTGIARFEEAALAVNLEAAAEIARQVRLRNLAGLIVIDFLHLEQASQRARVTAALKSAFAGDPAGVQLVGFTSLGLFELTRRRVRASLSDALTEGCEACRGQGRVASAATVAYEVLRAVERAARATPSARLGVVAAAPVIAALEGEARPARERLERELAATLSLRVGPSHRRDEFDIVTAPSAAG
ncbi:MAG TPA: Rne/Rng family ribonuclease [Alphaproteobacteria bacterium]|nr:Rne/Rng family ribonuclease [Alphaproteobacteria bacterium]